MRKRTKLKKHSCAMCKPYKMKKCDKRSILQIKADEKYKQEVGKDH